MTTNGFFDFHLLNEAPYGAYAVDLGQTILFWNRSAERILGHAAHEVIGLRCYQVLQSLPENGTAPVCMEGCPSILHARAGQIPPIIHVMARCASGRRKQITVTPLVFPRFHGDQTVLVHLFHEWTEDARARTVAGAVHEALLAGESSVKSTGPAADPARRNSIPLTARELEVLRLMALALKTGEIADQLNVSANTARNHVRNVCAKLQARSKLDAVVTAQRCGLL